MRPVPASISASCQGLWWQTGTSGFAVWPPGSRRGTYHTVQTGLSRGPSWYFHLSQSKCLPYWIFFSRKPHYSDSWVEIEKKYNNGLMLNWNKHKKKTRTSTVGPTVTRQIQDRTGSASRKFVRQSVLNIYNQVLTHVSAFDFNSCVSNTS